jgi:hypothetical protein
MAEKVKLEPEVYIYRLIKKNDVVRDADGLVLDQSQPEYPPYVSINNPCNVNFNGRIRKMRFIDGFDKIWVDEQPEKIEDSVLQSELNIIIIKNGELRVNSYEKAKLEFINNHPANPKSPYKMTGVMPLFELSDEGAAALEELELQELRFDAMAKARALKDDEMLVHAKEIGIVFTETNGQLSRDVAAIKKDYRAFAEKNPKAFLDTYEDPKIKIRYWVKKALEENVIDLETVPGQAKWTQTKGLISAIPDGSDVVDFLTNLTYVDAGAELKKRLIKLYDK